jgi:SAM-dependent methyltransferase
MPTNKRPANWSEENAAAFQLADVVAHYHLRAPYPLTLAPFLLTLGRPARGAVLDLGCGTGDIARRLAPDVARVDAVDVSRPMLDRARALPGGDDPSIRWFEARAEEAPLAGPYSLAIRGASLHWMDWNAVLPRIAEHLAADAGSRHRRRD